MENAFNKVEELADNIKQYVNNRFDLVKLTVAEKSSLVIATLVAFVIVLLFFTFFIGFASLAIAVLLGGWIGQLWAGYLIVAGLHLLAVVVIWRAKSKCIRFPVMNKLLKQLFQKDEYDK